MQTSKQEVFDAKSGTRLNLELAPERFDRFLSPLCYRSCGKLISWCEAHEQVRCAFDSSPRWPSRLQSESQSSWRRHGSGNPSDRWDPRVSEVLDAAVEGDDSHAPRKGLSHVYMVADLGRAPSEHHNINVSSSHFSCFFLLLHSFLSHSFRSSARSVLCLVDFRLYEGLQQQFF